MSNLTSLIFYTHFCVCTLTVFFWNARCLRDVFFETVNTSLVLQAMLQLCENCVFEVIWFAPCIFFENVNMSLVLPLPAGGVKQKLTLDAPPLGVSKPCKYVYLSSDASHAAGCFIDGWFALMIGLL